MNQFLNRSAEYSNNQEKRRPRVAVTGAGGMVGSYLVKYLANKGYPVTIVLRTPGKPDHLMNFVNLQNSDLVQIRIADVNDLDSLCSAFEDANVVVHAAGNVNPYGSRTEIFRTNVGGTETALTAAKKSKVTQFIYVSSLSVITGFGDQYNVTESAPIRRCGEAYADSKATAEESVMKEIAIGAINACSIRPGFIYGPYERTWLPRLIQSISTGKAALIDGGTKETNVVYIENLCRAIEGAIVNSRSYGQVYNITDGQKVTKKDLLDAIADGLMLPRVTKQVPGFIARPFFELVSTVAPSLPVDTQKSLARYSRAAYRLVGLNQGFSIQKAEKELDYLNRVPFAQGMHETLNFFRNHIEDTSAKIPLRAHSS